MLMRKTRRSLFSGYLQPSGEVEAVKQVKTIYIYSKIVSHTEKHHKECHALVNE